jgi:hypothetical protein
MAVQAKPRLSVLRWLLAVVIGPVLSALLWSFVVTWSRDGGVYVAHSVLCAVSALVVAAAIGIPIHLSLNRARNGIWALYAVAGALAGPLLYLLGWLTMSLNVNGMDIGPAIAYSLNGIGIFPDMPLSIFCGALSGLVFWLSFRK